MIERSDVLELMSTLKLYGMRAAYDEVMTTGIKRRHEPPHIVGDLLSAEIAEKQARSIKYQLTIAKLPLAKDIDDFDFAGTPVNQALIRDLASGTFLAEQRNAVLVGGTGTGKSHLAIAIARACIRGGARGRFYTVVDLVNRLESEARAGRQGRLADYLTRLDFVILDELGYLPFAPVSTRTPKRARSIASWVKACTARIALPALEPSGRLRQERRRPPPRALSTGRTTVSSSSKLFAALKDGRLGGAALDVWWQYPTPDEPERRPSRRPFHELSNVLITPHSSSSSAATADRRWSAVAANLDRYARGENLENIVLQT